MFDPMFDVPEGQLPADRDAEQALISRVLYAPEVFDSLSVKVLPEYFSHRPYRAVWDACLALAQKDTAIDSVAVAGHLMAEKKLGLVGGLTGLSAMDNGLGTIFGEADYINRVREKWQKRKILGVAHKMHTETRKGGSAAEIAAANQELLRSIAEQAETRTPDLSLGQVIREAGGPDVMTAKQTPACPLPWAGANDILGGGFFAKDLIVLGARPSVGKTALAVQIAYDAAVRRGVASVMFTLEMSKESIVTRMACAASDTDYNAMRQGKLTRSERNKVSTAMVENAELPIYLDDTSYTVSAMRSVVRNRLLTTPLGLVIVDYLQFAKADGQHENNNVRVDSISKGLKIMAKELCVPVLVLSQLNRDVARRKKEKGGGSSAPQLEDLRDSGSIEQDADVVGFLHRTEEADRYGTLQSVLLIIRKQRNGPLGTVDLNFRTRCARFEDPCTVPEPRDYTGGFHEQDD